MELEAMYQAAKTQGGYALDAIGADQRIQLPRDFTETDARFRPRLTGALFALIYLESHRTLWGDAEICSANQWIFMGDRPTAQP
jgi:hypothetical protein